jgi:hypothetical protein
MYERSIGQILSVNPEEVNQFAIPSAFAQNPANAELGGCIGGSLAIVGVGAVVYLASKFRDH